MRGLQILIARLLTPTLGFVMLFLTFVVLAVVFYSFCVRYFVSRSNEIAKRVPIGSKELRRRRKAFYDGLPK